MSEHINASSGQFPCISLLATDVVKKLEDKKAFRTDLPFHLDRDMFLFLAKKDVEEVLATKLGEPGELLPLCPKCNVKHSEGLTCIPPAGEPSIPTDKIAMRETELDIKRKKVNDFLEKNKTTLIDFGFNGLADFVKTATIEELDSVLEKISQKKEVIHILEVREIDHKNKESDSPSLKLFPNKTKFTVGVFSSEEKAMKWIEENPHFHAYEPADFFYVLMWGYIDDYSPPIVEGFYDLNGNII